MTVIIEAYRYQWQHIQSIADIDIRTTILELNEDFPHWNWRLHSIVNMPDMAMPAPSTYRCLFEGVPHVHGH